MDDVPIMPAVQCNDCSQSVSRCNCPMDISPRENQNDRLLRAMRESKQNTSPTEELCDIFADMIVANLVRRWGDDGLALSIREDRLAYTTSLLMRVWSKFDETKSSNAHAYITTCIASAFIYHHHQRLKGK